MNLKRFNENKDYYIFVSGVTTITFAVILMCVGIVFQLNHPYSKTVKPNDSVDDNSIQFQNTSTNSEIVGIDQFDFYDMSITVKNVLSYDSNSTYLVNCMDNSIEEVSNNSFDTIMEKLHTAYQVEKNVTASFSCNNISYSVGSVVDGAVNPSYFSLYYIDKSNMLIVDYNGNAYAFYYRNKEEISDLIPNLK